MALDWPLSREEKKGRLIRLHDNVVQEFSETQKYDELRIDVLRRELIEAHRRGDTLSSSHATRHGSLGDVPAVAWSSPVTHPSGAQPADAHGSGCNGAAEALALQHSLAKPRRKDKPNERDERDDELLQNFKMAFGFAKDAVDGSLSALGSLFSGVNNETDSDECAYLVKLRARSEGARVRGEFAPPALKKPNSRRNSRGAPIRRVSFVESVVDSDDDDDDDDNDDESQEKICPPDIPHKMATQCFEEQEPMGEPEPFSPMSRAANDETGLIIPALSEHFPYPVNNITRRSGRDRSRDRNDTCNGGDNDEYDRSLTPRGTRKELRVLLDVRAFGLQGKDGAVRERSAEPLEALSGDTDLLNVGAGKLSTARRARRRGRLHGYSICDAAEEE